MISLIEQRRRDGSLRAYLLGRDFDLDSEHLLRRHLAAHSLELLPRWPYLVGLEWRASDGSQGDLVFGDGGESFAVIEVKHLGDRDRTRRRGDVEDQAYRFAQCWRGLHPSSVVTPLVYTCDERIRSAPPRAPADRGHASATRG